LPSQYRYPSPCFPSPTGMACILGLKLSTLFAISPPLS
jgi:hypothetical protein